MNRMMIFTVMFLLIGAFGIAIAGDVQLSEAKFSNDCRDETMVQMRLDNILLLKLDTLYQGRLKSNPSLAGVIELTLTIEEIGEVDEVKILSDEMEDEEFTKQVKTTVKTMRFDPSYDSVDATISITFGKVVEE